MFYNIRGTENEKIVLQIAGKDIEAYNKFYKQSTDNKWNKTFLLSKLNLKFLY